MFLSVSFSKYITSDTKGHNGLCGHKQTGCQTHNRLPGSYTSVDPDEVDPLIMQDMTDTKGSAAKMGQLGLHLVLPMPFVLFPL